MTNRCVENRDIRASQSELQFHQELQELLPISDLNIKVSTNRIRKVVLNASHEHSA